MTLRNIGGLVDGRIDIPLAPVVALAGANGSGKSRLLRALAAPWTQQIPEPADPTRESYVEVNLNFDDVEIAAQIEYALQQRIDAPVPQRELRIRLTQSPLAGISTGVEPFNSSWIAKMLTSEEVGKYYPSFSMVFVPAERRLTSFGGAFTLVSINPEDNARAVAALREGYGPTGLLDDYEFEDYARTLCIAAYLPSADGLTDAEARSAWDRFLEAVNGVLEPKRLLPLTQEEPSRLRIGIPDGSVHGIDGLSSGERQALIIISRIFRAGEGRSLVVIDEPDAYLHPSLSARLMHALRLGLVEQSGLIVATHSPSILDGLDPAEILRFQHGARPAPVLDEASRIDLYRSAGFRASAVTQSDLLVLTEGSFDAQVLRDLVPELRNASIRSAGGRDLVLRDVKALHGFDLPILGVVDADVLADEPHPEIAANCHIWPAADIEGVLLSSDAFLQHCVDARLLNEDYGSLPQVHARFEQLLAEFQSFAINEYAMRSMRQIMSPSWPSPHDPDAVQKLESLGSSISEAIGASVKPAFDRAEDEWNSGEMSKWNLVRGKYVLNKVVRSMTSFQSSDAFIRAALAGRPVVAAVEDFRARVLSLLG